MTRDKMIYWTVGSFVVLTSLIITSALAAENADKILKDLKLLREQFVAQSTELRLALAEMNETRRSWDEETRSAREEMKEGSTRLKEELRETREREMRRMVEALEVRSTGEWRKLKEELMGMREGDVGNWRNELNDTRSKLEEVVDGVRRRLEDEGDEWEQRWHNNRVDLKRLAEKTTRRYKEMEDINETYMTRIRDEVDEAARQALAASSFRCDSGHVSSPPLTSSSSDVVSSFVSFSSSFSSPPHVVVGARYAGAWPMPGMMPRGGGLTSWTATSQATSGWSSVASWPTNDRVTSTNQRGAVDFGVWVQGRPSTEGFIVAFQTGTPRAGARIAANWMACGR